VSQNKCVWMHVEFGKFVLIIISVSKSLIILNLRFPSTVSQNKCVWMHVEFCKFVLMILAFSKSLIFLNLTFLPPFPLKNAYESWWNISTIFLIPCKKETMQCPMYIYFYFLRPSVSGATAPSGTWPPPRGALLLLFRQLVSSNPVSFKFFEPCIFN